MHPYLELAITVGASIVLPIYWLGYWIIYVLLRATLYVLHPLLSVTLFILQPIIFAGVFVARLAYLPVDIFARFETIYIYLGVGSLVGLMTGLILYLNISFLSSVLGLNSSSPSSSPPARPRESSRRQNGSKSTPKFSVHQSPDLPLQSPVKSDSARLYTLPKLTVQGPSPEGNRRRTLLDQTMDADYDSEI